MGLIGEHFTDDPQLALDVSCQLKRMLSIPIIWTPDPSEGDLDLQIQQSFYAQIALHQLINNNISFEDYRCYLEEIGIQSQSLIDIWDEEVYLTD